VGENNPETGDAVRGVRIEVEALCCPHASVSAAPLTISTFKGFTRPPVSYTPLVTRIWSPATAASTASWMAAAAVVQLV
jgi:hypothetical protein